jgi:hypothetical protein
MDEENLLLQEKCAGQANEERDRPHFRAYSYNGPWTSNEVIHLLKAMFGSTPDDISFFLGLGSQSWNIINGVSNTTSTAAKKL